MPGRPREREFIKFMESEDGWREDALFEHLANGASLTSFTDTLKEWNAPGGTSRHFIYRFLHSTPERERRWAEAKRTAAGAHAERAGEILDDAAKEGPGLSSSQATIARERSGYQRWLASVRDRDEFGERGAAVNINIGELHLDALRQVGRLPTPSVPELEDGDGHVLEAEVLGIEPEGADESSRGAGGENRTNGTGVSSVDPVPDDEQGPDQGPTRLSGAAAKFGVRVEAG